MENEIHNISEKIESSSSQFDILVYEMYDIINAIPINYDVSVILNSEKEIPSYDWFTELKAFENFLEAVSAKRSGTYHVSVLDMDNKLYRSGAKYNSFLTMDSELSQRLLENGNDILVINRYLEGIDDVDMLTIGKVYYKNSQMSGIVFVDTPVDTIESMFKLFEEEYHKVFVLNSEGQVLYSNQPGIMTANLPEEISGMIGAEREAAIIDGEQYVCAQRTSEMTGNTIVVLASEGFVFAESSGLFTQFVIVISIVILLTIVAIGILSGRITKGIKILNKEVYQYSLDGHEINLNLKTTDEVGQLTHGFVVMSRRINHMVQQIREDEETKWGLEYQALQSQVNPHMIYNTLNTISYLAELQHVPNIQEIATAFASLLRMISNYPSEFITVGEEVDIVKYYIALREYNLLCNVNVRFDIDDQALPCPIPKLLLQPLVENAYIHGFHGEVSQGLLQIRILLAGGSLCIDINDNGVGIPEERLQQIMGGEIENTNTFSSVGIYNTLQRLRIQYGDKLVFHIHSKEGKGTRIHMEIPGEIPSGAQNRKGEAKDETGFLC